MGDTLIGLIREAKFLSLSRSLSHAIECQPNNGDTEEQRIILTGETDGE